MIGEWSHIPALAAALAAFGLAGLVLTRYGSGAFAKGMATLLFASGLIQAANGMGVLDNVQALAWRRVALLGELAQPAALLWVGLGMWASDNPGSVQANRWRAHAVAALAAVGMMLAWSDLVYRLERTEPSATIITFGTAGRVVYSFIVVSLALGLAQLEQVLRATRDPLRRQLKFVLIGVGALAGYSIYQASHLLRLPVWRSDYVLIGGLATLISVCVAAYGLRRYRRGDMQARVSVSRQVLYGSVTFTAVGLYLVAVGLIGQVIRYANVPRSVAWSTLLVFVALIGLATAFFSRRARAELRRFVARHFYRSKYDYRAKWLEVTEAFRRAASVDAILDQLLHLLNCTVGAKRISIWMWFDADGRYHQVRTVGSLERADPLEDTYPLVCWLRRTDEPVAVAEILEPEAPSEPTGWRPFLESTKASLCVPIRAEGELLAFAALSEELRGDPYGTEDRDLLWAIGQHVGVLLSHARLSEERRSAAELDALHRFSAFCLHDLKNLASRLSLVVQNAEVQSKEPAFWQSAMRTVATTVQRMLALIAKLKDERFERRVSEAVDIHEVISETLDSVDDNLSAMVTTTKRQVPPVLIDREQLHHVLVNLLLNAAQAADDRHSRRSDRPAAIEIGTTHVNGTVVVTLADSGPGIPEAELRTLFQPFRSTKPGGLGLGLYQCKRIIEAHDGKLRVSSEEGRGTHVRIELPIAGQATSP